MNLANDYLYDYVLKLFTESLDGHGALLSHVNLESVYTIRNNMIRQLLYAIILPLAHSSNTDIKDSRALLENLDDLVEILKRLIDNEELTLVTDQYLEEVVETLQVLATNSQHNKATSDSLQELKQHTASLIIRFRKYLSAPIVGEIEKRYKDVWKEKQKKDANAQAPTLQDSQPLANDANVTTEEPQASTSAQQVYDKPSSPMDNINEGGELIPSQEEQTQPQQAACSGVTAPGSSSEAPAGGDKTSKGKKKRRLWDGDGQILKWDDDPILKPNFVTSQSDGSTRRKIAKVGSKKKFWLDWEVKNLVKGLRRYGVGQWAMIMDKYDFQNRNSVMLKDKYRNMLKSNQLPPDLTPE